jgi:hypothetical protein
MAIAKNWISLVAALTLAMPAAHARAETTGSMLEEQYKSRISEFYYSRTGTEILKPVQIMGQVGRPGLYHLPVNTSLLTLLTISGGTVQDADNAKMLVRTPQGVREENLYQMIKEGRDISLTGGEIIVVPQKTPWIQADVVNGVTVLTGIMTAILTGLLVSNELKK